MELTQEPGSHQLLCRAQPGQALLSRGPRQMEGPCPPHSALGSPRVMLGLMTITDAAFIVTLGSDGAVHRQLAQTFSPRSVLGTAIGCGFKSNCSPPPLSIQTEMGADIGSLTVCREPPDCKPCSRSSNLPHCPILLQAGTPRRLCPGCCDPQSLSTAQRPPLSVSATPSQLCEPSLGIWFISSWQCQPSKCHGMQKSMKTRDPRHVFLFVCMCQHFQWLRNVCL